MQSQLKSLSKIFSETIFRIPDYQRGYSWEEKHLKDFWNDIEQLQENKSHYTGVLTLEPVSPENFNLWEDDLWIIKGRKFTPVYVVDGQQRLTTAIILIKCIFEKIPDEGQINFTSKVDVRKKYIFETKDSGISRSYIFGYEKDNPSYEFLKTVVLAEKSTNHHLPEETIYTKNLEFAKKFFTSKLSNLPYTELENIFTTITQNMLFLIFYIEEELDVFVTFETMNNRGKQLSHLELLKNRLIYLSTKFNGEASEKALLRKSINESWKTIYHHLGKVKSKRFTDDSFLQSYFIYYLGLESIRFIADDDDSAISENDESIFDRGISFSDDEYKDFLLDTFFSPKRLLPDHPKPLNLEAVFSHAQHIKNFTQNFFYITTPDASPWSDRVKITLSQINRLANTSLFMLTIACILKYTAEKKVTEDILIEIERFGFLKKLKHIYIEDLEYNNLVLRISDGKISADKVLQYLKECSDKIITASDFLDSIKNIGKGTGYYGWIALRYFMYEYEQHLRGKSMTSRQLLTWIEYKSEHYDTDHKTIEHIYPQKASDPYWQEMFKHYSIKERNTLRNSLGNLLPVSHAKNSSLSNKAFNAKKGTEFNQGGYKYGCLSEIQVSEIQEWGANEILRRGLELLEFMEQRWKFKIKSDKIEILGLSFVPEKENNFDKTHKLI
jgi:uncharacterized protein with ParB-like and HNH nuclease domain